MSSYRIHVQNNEKLDNKINFDKLNNYTYKYVGLQWNLRTRDTLVSVLLSLVERLSLSRRFCFFYCDSAYISFI